MDLREARVAKQGAAAVGAPDGRTVGGLGVGREVEDIGVPSRCQHDHVGGVTFQFASHQVPRHNAARLAVDDHHVEQLAADMHRHCASCHLLFQGLIRAEQ